MKYLLLKLSFKPIIFTQYPLHFPLNSHHCASTQSSQNFLSLLIHNLPSFWPYPLHYFLNMILLQLNFRQLIARDHYVLGDYKLCNLGLGNLKPPLFSSFLVSLHSPKCVENAFYKVLLMTFPLFIQQHCCANNWGKTISLPSFPGRCNYFWG